MKGNFFDIRLDSSRIRIQNLKNRICDPVQNNDLKIRTDIKTCIIRKHSFLADLSVALLHSS